MSDKTDITYNRCYCCLSLRAGNILSTLLPLISTLFWHLLYYHDKENFEELLDISEREIELVPTITLSLVIEIITYLMGLIGSVMASYNIIKIYRLFALYRAIEEPTRLIVQLLSADLLNTFGKGVPGFEEGSSMRIGSEDYFFQFWGGLFTLILTGIAIGRKIYTLYIAHKYQRYLLTLQKVEKKA